MPDSYPNLTSTARFIRALAANTQNVENYATLLSTSSAQGISALASKMTVLPSSLTFIHSATTSAIPYFAMIDGFSRLALGLSQIVLYCWKTDSIFCNANFSNLNIVYEDTELLTFGIYQIIKSTPLLLTTFLLSAPLGFAITNTSEFFTYSLAVFMPYTQVDAGAIYDKLISEDISKGRQRPEDSDDEDESSKYSKYETANFQAISAKFFEAAGWWMLVFAATNPAIAPIACFIACLTFFLSAVIKACRSKLYETAKEDIEYLQKKISKYTEKTSEKTSKNQQNDKEETPEEFVSLTRRYTQ